VGQRVSKWFYDTSTGAATGAAHCSFLLEGTLVPSLLAMDEHGGHEDLRGSGRWSVIPYVYGRTELYCSSVPCLSLPFPPPLWKWRLPEPFIAQGQAVTMSLEAR
jgi:hypothetical protein